jgi:hypothetical protein
MERQRLLELYLYEPHRYPHPESLLSVEAVQALYADLVAKVLADFGLDAASADNLPGPCYDEVTRRWPGVLSEKEAEMQLMLYQLDRHCVSYGWGCGRPDGL